MKIYNKNKPYPSDAVYIGRGTDWGNPFIMKRESDRFDVCSKFLKYALWRRTIEPDWLEPLRGKSLVCHCAPKKCHGEILILLANEVKS